MGCADGGGLPAAQGADGKKAQRHKSGCTRIHQSLHPTSPTFSLLSGQTRCRTLASPVLVQRIVKHTQTPPLPAAFCILETSRSTGSDLIALSLILFHELVFSDF